MTDGYGNRSYAMLAPIPDDAVMNVFESLIEAYAKEITPEHGFKVNSHSYWKGKKRFTKIVKNLKIRKHGIACEDMKFTWLKGILKRR